MRLRFARKEKLSCQTSIVSNVCLPVEFRRQVFNCRFGWRILCAFLVGHPHHGEYDYVFFSERETWSGAAEHCQRLGGQLSLGPNDRAHFDIADIIPFEDT